ncbi:MAG TPA: hypothetical protein VH475_17280 [Tepidisphaeraceae bacterium]
MDVTKDAVAQRLAQAHFEVEPGIVRIVRLLAPEGHENDPAEPIKLLEVNQNTTAHGIIPVHFGPHSASGICYPSMIVEVTPKEFEQIRQDPTRLPNEWRLGGEFVNKPARAAVGG